MRSLLTFIFLCTLTLSAFAQRGNTTVISSNKEVKTVFDPSIKSTITKEEILERSQKENKGTRSAVVVLDFEGLGNFDPINNFYNGGTSGQGYSGTNHAIGFSSSSLSIIDSDAGGGGNIANEPSPSTVLFFLGADPILNIPAGFTVGMSFYYSTATPGGAVSVYSGLNGTGALLGSVSLPILPLGSAGGDPSGFYDTWGVAFAGFAGTGYSAVFSGVANFIAFDDLTFGSIVPGCDDPDEDDVCVEDDNCPDNANPGQEDTDGDGDGDACDDDDDGDGCLDVDDSNPLVYSGDSDCDGTHDDCDVCPGGDDSVDNNNDSIPDCSQLLFYEDYSDAWKCAANKLDICHVDDLGDRHTICVSKNSVAAHLAHGDWAGPCVGCESNIGTPISNRSFDIADPLEMELVPNPASSLVNVHLHGLADGESTLVVYDQLGKVVLSQKIEEGAHQLLLDLSSGKFSTGLHFVRLTSGQATLTQRLIVARK